MKRTLPTKIEAVLLYDENVILGVNAWEKLINEFSAKNNVTFQTTKNVKTPDFYHFLSDEITVEVDYVSEPVSAEAFENCLSSEFTKSTFPEAAEAVAAHRSYVHIVITNGQIDPPDPFVDEVPEHTVQAFDADTFDFAAELLRWLAIVQVNAGGPLAVYWAQSDKLIGVKEFLRQAIEFKDPALMIHPFYFSQINAETGQEEYSLHTWGAASLIGSEIRFDYDRVPHEDLFSCVMHLIGITGATGLMVPDNHVFGRSEGEEIRVSRSEDEQGSSLIELKFDRCDAFGITSEDIHVPEIDEEFDLEDPAERAMFERIKSKQKQEQAVQNENDPSGLLTIMASSEEAQPEEVWEGGAKKVDIASLRDLVKASNPDPEFPAQTSGTDLGENLAEMADSENKTSKPLLKKVGGLFSRRQ